MGRSRLAFQLGCRDTGRFLAKETEMESIITPQGLSPTEEGRQ